MPFGEYLPLYNGWLLGDFSYGFAAGKEAKVFEISGMRIIPLICYESVVPNVVAQSVGYDAAGKVFVVASQNGWYKSRFQVQQHSSLSSIRAVENRVPLVHSINNGFSSITMPDGKVIFKTPYEKTGAWVFEMPFDKNSGGSFYSKHYNWFANLIRIFIFGIVGFVLIKAKEIAFLGDFRTFFRTRGFSFLSTIRLESLNRIPTILTNYKNFSSCKTNRLG